MYSMGADGRINVTMVDKRLRQVATSFPCGNVLTDEHTSVIIGPPIPPPIPTTIQSPVGCRAYGIDHGVVCRFRANIYGKLFAIDGMSEFGFGYQELLFVPGAPGQADVLYSIRTTAEITLGILSTTAEVVALDPLSLQARRTFGRGHLARPCALVLVGDELYVFDTIYDPHDKTRMIRSRLLVFALSSGEYRREVTGDDLAKLRECSLEYYDGRLYAAETARRRRQCHNGCICVLTTEGRTLQIYDLDDASDDRPRWVINSMTVFDEKLIVSGTVWDEEHYLAASCGPLPPGRPVIKALWGV